MLLSNVTRAKIFAKVAHYGQKYGENKSYFYHLEQVYEKVKQYSDNETVLIAALLHDVLEDTKYTRKNIKNFFGVQVSTLCWMLMDEKGKNRKERHEKTYPKIALSKKATLIKLCDRYCNVKESLSNKEKLKMYRKEHEYFKKFLYIYEEHKMLQKEIDQMIYSV